MRDDVTAGEALARHEAAMAEQERRYLYEGSGLLKTAGLHRRVDPDGTAVFSFLSGVELAIKPDPDGASRAVEVHVRFSDGLRPTDLSRVPWERYLSRAAAMVEVERRYRDGLMTETESISAQGKLHTARQRKPEPLIERVYKRPGRGGHPDEFYKEIAARVLMLRRGGASNPARVIAAERHVAESTAKGWLREARIRKLLPGSEKGTPNVG